MPRRSLLVRSLAMIAALVLFVLAGGVTFAVADDYLYRDVLPAGATVAGIDVSGLTRDEARDLVTETVIAPLLSPMTVTSGGQSFSLEPSAVVQIDADAMIAEAFAPKASATLPVRVADRALRRPSGAAAELAITLDEAAIDAWLAGVAVQVDRPAVDATLTLDVNKLVLSPAVPGQVLDAETTKSVLRDALAAGQKSVELAVTYIEPSIVETELPPAIVVDISERRLRLYEKGVLAKEYGVAVGTPAYPTPRGEFEIVQKRYMPTWSNPGSAWAAGMPRTIGPGPNNPLGTRALNLDASGIRIHGTSKDYSIGTAASHGCMRMHRWDIEDLYDRVEVGTPVYIVR